VKQSKRRFAISASFDGDRSEDTRRDFTRTMNAIDELPAPEDITPDLEPNPYTEDGGES
jgi:hypothetical protein